MEVCTGCGKQVEPGMEYLRTRIRGELHYFCCSMCVSAFEAAQVQRRMIPASFEDESISVFLDYLPALQIGGDYAFARRTSDDRLYLIVGDVSGHGIGASLLMSRVALEVETLAESGAPIDELAGALDKVMARNRSADEGLYLTFFGSILDLRTKTLTFVNCGHPAPFVWQSSEQIFRSLPSRNLPVGFFSFSGDRPTDEVLTFSPGDALVLYTDGLSELEQPAGSQFGENGIKELTRNFVQSPGRSTADQVFKKVRRLREEDLSDDILIVLVAFHQGIQG